MLIDRQQRVETLFRQALERPREQRAKFLQESCESDLILCAEVESLIRHHERAGTLEAAAGGPSSFFGHEALGPEAHDDLPSGATIGAYRIIDRVGRGGMGVVYRARQEQPDRIVALKVIRSELATGEFARRFGREAQVLGRLHHPGIAQIFEAGVADLPGPSSATTGIQRPPARVPFFAMEFIQGVPLTDFVQQRDLPPQQRLELMARVCDAVAHAHQQGVIHRDLKPGNILVDSAGQPKVLDFGVARIVDADVQSTLHTSVGALIGTIQYMSPEQAGGNAKDVDAQSDVYALGVLAYEVLSRRRPYDVTGKSVPDALLVIRDNEPTPLGTIHRHFRGDIETIVGRALEKEKTHRYGSAAELAADIRRYLGNEPILARPPSVLYQLGKLARRHRGAFAASAGALAFLVLGLAGTTWQAVRATRQRDRAVAAEKQADRRLQERDTEARKARQINAFLIDMLKNAMPSASPGREVTVREVVDRAARRIEGQLAGHAQVEAAVRSTLAEVYISLSRMPEALEQARRAVEAAEGAGSPNDDLALDVRNVLGVALRKNGDYAGSEEVLSETLRRCREVHGDDHVLTLGSLHSLAVTLEARSRLDEAEALLNEAIQGRERLLGRGHEDTLSTINALGLLVHSRGRPQDAEPLFREAVESRMKIAPPDDPQTTTAQSNLASVLRSLKRLDEAGDLLDRVIESQKRVVGPTHVATLQTLSTRASVYLDQQRYADAEKLYREVIDALGQTLGERHPDRLVVMNNLAVLLRRSGRLDDANTLYGELLEAIRATFGPDHVNTYGLMANRAGVLADLGRVDESRALYEQALSGMKTVLGENHPDVRRIAGKLEELSGPPEVADPKADAGS